MISDIIDGMTPTPNTHTPEPPHPYVVQSSDGAALRVGDRCYDCIDGTTGRVVAVVLDAPPGTSSTAVLALDTLDGSPSLGTVERTGAVLLSIPAAIAGELTEPAIELDYCPSCGRRIVDADVTGVESADGQRYCVVHAPADVLAQLDNDPAPRGPTPAELAAELATAGERPPARLSIVGDIGPLPDDLPVPPRMTPARRSADHLTIAGADVSALPIVRGPLTTFDIAQLGHTVSAHVRIDAARIGFHVEPAGDDAAEPTHYLTVAPAQSYAHSPVTLLALADNTAARVLDVIAHAIADGLIGDLDFELFPINGNLYTAPIWHVLRVTYTGAEGERETS